MSGRIGWSEDSPQTLIIRDFHERTQGNFVVIRRTASDLGYLVEVRPLDMIGVVAEAGHKNPLQAERMALARALALWEESLEAREAELPEGL